MKTFLTDLHVHSDFSDGTLSIPEVVDLFGSRGFGAISITDHICEEGTLIGKAARYINQTLTRATWPIYMEILHSEARRAWAKWSMVVIPGFELSKNSVSNRRSAHILGIGVNDFLQADGDAPELTSGIRAQGALAVAAHPVNTRKMEKQTYHLWDRREELRDCFDAWEVASGPYLFDEVAETTLPKLATSDLHRASQMTSWKTLMSCERDQAAILQAVRDQRLSFVFYNDEGRTHDDPRRLVSGHPGRGAFDHGRRNLAG
jgi:predicted metal-dependent phosphoesterase TrpH